MKLRILAFTIVLSAATHAQQPVADSEQASEPAPPVTQIYKQVLSDGSIIYSDQAPTPNATPMTELPELTVVQPQQIPRRNTNIADSTPTPTAAYEGFALIEPVADQVYWNTSFTITARTASNIPLVAGHQVRFLLDGQNRGETESYSMSIDEIYRGEHRLSAQVINSRGEVLASTGPVRFHMKHSTK